MADKTAIEWTDATWNPVRGCSRISPGCGGPNHEGGCYAEKIAARFSDPGQPFHGYAKRTPHGGAWTGRMGLVDNALTLPLRWKKPRRIFVNSMSDLFHENLPDEAIDRVFAVMALAPQHTFQVLTKRAERMRDYMTRIGIQNRLAWDVTAKVMDRWCPTWGEENPDGPHRSRAIAAFTKWPLPNVWLGASAEDQQRADERRESLADLALAGWRTFASYEPALGPVNWFGWEFLDWLISGGESGPKSRPSHPEWHRAARDFCTEHGIAYFFKQWGAWGPDDAAPNAHTSMRRVGKKAAGALLDGREHKEFPA